MHPCGRMTSGTKGRSLHSQPGSEGPRNTCDESFIIREEIIRQYIFIMKVIGNIEKSVSLMCFKNNFMYQKDKYNLISSL